VSHSKERHEKICLNCNTALNGRFCHICGQENIEPKESVWGLISHFFYDITHFDGKFFGTTGTLFRRPGLLPKEYIEGKRARYLHPIRMYVFTSAFFFLIFFSQYSAKNIDLGSDKDLEYSDSTRFALQAARETALQYAANKDDSIDLVKVFDEILPASAVDSTSGKRKKKPKDDNKNVYEADGKTNWNVDISEVKYRNRREYDSVQKALPESVRDGWWRRLTVRRNLEIKEKYKGNKEAFGRELIDRFLHTFPYLLFISLPLYALFLKLLYIRRRQYYYVDHGIFLIYLYIFSFLLLLVVFGLDALRQSLHWDWMGWLETILILYGIYYAWRAMHKFYGQGKGRTTLKFILLNILASISLLILFLLFFLLAVFRA
jgi:hypothetical protein